MAKRSIKKQRGRGQAQSAPAPPPPQQSLIEIIRSGEEDPEIKSDNILDAIHMGANINERDEDGSSPLIELMIHTNQDGMEFMYFDPIIEQLTGNDINYVGPQGSALHCAVFNIQEEYMQRLLQLRADVNVRNNNGETPLFIASLNGISQYVRSLLNFGADPNIPDNNGRLPIQVAALQGGNGEDTRLSIIGFFCDRNIGVGGPECQEYQAWLANLPVFHFYRFQRRVDGFEGPGFLPNNNMNVDPVPQITIPEVSQGPKVVPREKITNIISYDDIKNGDDIIVITEENGAEFFYKLDTITQWFATKDAEGNEKTNPGSGSIIERQDQVTRWIADIKPQTGGRRTKKAKKGKKSKTRSKTRSRA